MFASCKVFSFSHVKAKQDQECGGKVCRNTKGSASFFSHVKAKQGQDLVFLTSKQSKAKTSCDSKMVDKTVVQEREHQCKAEIKETSSAQCPVSLKGRRLHAPRGSTVPLHYTHKSNPLFERQNCVVEQNLRSLMKQERTKDWVSLVPLAVLTMNSQRSSSTSFTPHELFQ